MPPGAAARGGGRRSAAPRAARLHTLSPRARASVNSASASVARLAPPPGSSPLGNPPLPEARLHPHSLAGPTNQGVTLASPELRVRWGPPGELLRATPPPSVRGVLRRCCKVAPSPSYSYSAAGLIFLPSSPPPRPLSITRLRFALGGYFHECLGSACVL